MHRPRRAASGMHRASPARACSGRAPAPRGPQCSPSARSQRPIGLMVPRPVLIRVLYVSKYVSNLLRMYCVRILVLEQHTIPWRQPRAPGRSAIGAQIAHAEGEAPSPAPTGSGRRAQYIYKPELWRQRAKSDVIVAALPSHRQLWP